MPEAVEFDYGCQILMTKRLRAALTALVKLQDCPVSRSLLFRHTDIWNENEECYYDLWFTTDAKANYLDLSTLSGYISYLPAGREYLGMNRYTDLYEDTGGRQTGRAGKVARMCMTPLALEQFTDKAFENFSNYLKAYTAAGEGEFSIVRGDEIPPLFRERAYASNGGNLFKSCMRYDKCQPYLTLYAQNPGVISMLVKRDKEGMLIGRAMRWEHEGRVYVDRVYGNDATLQEFHNYAHEQGWLYRQENSIHKPTLFVEPGDTRARTETRLDIPIANFPYTKFPYLDTMKYFDYDANMLHNYEPRYAKYVILTEQDGGPQRIECASCAQAQFPGSMRRDDNYVYYCLTCWNTARCELCARNPKAQGSTYCTSCIHAHTCKHCYEFKLDVRGRVCQDCRNNHICSYCNSYEQHLEEGLCNACFEMRQRQQARLKEARSAREAALNTYVSQVHEATRTVYQHPTPDAPFRWTALPDDR
jgi:hypothetical protein